MKVRQLDLHGAGGKGGHTPTESPDSIFTNQIATVLDLISEGECEGIVGDKQGIFYNEVPWQDAQGNVNFTGVQVNVNNGRPDQAAMPGFADVKSTIQVNQDLPYGVNKTISFPNDGTITAVTVTLGGSNFFQVNKDGDTIGTAVSFVIEKSENGGAFAPAYAGQITGKQKGDFALDYTVRIGNPYGQTALRVRRLTGDASSLKVSNDISFRNYTKIVELKLSYPNMAIAGHIFDAKQFGNQVATRQYRFRGIKCRVPTNYDPATRAYTGPFTGAFTTVKKWTSNPAYQLYELVTNRRFGLGQFIDPALIDLPSLYMAGKWCDDLVSDGKGGMEPRWTCNTQITTRGQAFDLLKQLVSCFRGTLFWMQAKLWTMGDGPRTPVKIVTNANVIDGKFTYSGESNRSRFSVVNVSYNDPDLMFRRSIETVEDATLIRELGYKPTDFAGFGCTSRAQARRLGRAILFSQEFESELVTYSAGFDHMAVDADYGPSGIAPGDLILLADRARGNAVCAGIVTDSSGVTVTIDRAIGDTGTGSLYVEHSDGKVEWVSCTYADAGEAGAITLTQSPVQPVATGDMFILVAGGYEAEPFVVLKIAESGENILEVTAVRYDEDRFAAIYDDVHIDTSRYMSLPSVDIVAPVTDLKLSEAYITGIEQNRRVINIEWTGAADPLLDFYQVDFCYENGDWQRLTAVTGNSARIEDARPGAYQVKVTAVNRAGRKSAAVYETLETSAVPSTDVLEVGFIRKLSLQGSAGTTFGGRDAKLTWSFSTPQTQYAQEAGIAATAVATGISDPLFKDCLITVRRPNGTVLRTEAVIDNSYVYTYEKNYEDTGGTPLRQFTVAVQYRDIYGRVSPEASLALTNVAPTFTTAPTAQQSLDAVLVQLTPPQDLDYAGARTYVSLTSPVSLTPDNLRHSGPETQVPVPALQRGATHYIVVVPYDGFGDGTPSGQLSAVPVDVSARVDEMIRDTNADLSALHADIASANTQIAQNKTDLANAKTALESEISSANSDIAQTRSDLAAAKASLQSDIAATAQDVAQTRSDLNAAKTSLQGSIDATNRDVAQARSDISTTRGDLAAEVQRAKDDTASIRTVTTQLQQDVSGNRSLIETETTNRTNADSALANRATTIEAQINGTQDSWLAARIRDEATASANRDSAIAGRTSALETASRSSNNLVPNSEFVDTTGWSVSGNGLGGNPPSANFDGTWAPIGGTVLELVTYGVPPSGAFTQVNSPYIPVTPGSFIQFYAILANHRSRGWTSLFFVDASGADAGYAGENFGARVNEGGKDLNKWDYVGRKSMQVPSNAVAAYFSYRLYEYQGGENPVGWMFHPYLGSAVEGQTTWNAYSPGPSRNTQVATNARLTAEELARSTADGSLASRASSLETNYTNVRTDLNNWNNDRIGDIANANTRISDEITARSTVDAALGARSDAIEVNFTKSQRGILPTDFSGGDDAWSRYVVGGGSSWVYYEDTRNKNDWSKTDGMVITGVHQKNGYLYLFTRQDPIPVSAGDVVRLYASAGTYGDNGPCPVKLYFDCRDRNGAVLANSFNQGVMTVPLGYQNDVAGVNKYDTLAVDYAVPDGVSFVLPVLISNAGPTFAGPLFVRWLRFERSNGSAKNSASIRDEASARASADSALSTRASTLEAQVSGAQDSWLASRIRDEATASANRDSAIANRASTLEAQMSGSQDSWLATRIRDEATASANRDSAIANRTSVLEAAALPNGNLLPMTDFAGGRTDGWTFYDSTDFDSRGVNVPSDEWHPIGENVFGWHQYRGSGGTGLGSGGQFTSPLVPVAGGQIIQASVAMAAHRAFVEIGLTFYNGNGNEITTAYTGAQTAGSGGNSEYYFNRLGFKWLNVPSGAVSAMLRVGKWSTKDGETDSWVWVWRPYIGYAKANQTDWNPYSHGSATRSIVQAYAAISDEATARTGADGALSNRASTLEAQMRGDQDSWIAGRIRDEATASANRDGALANRASSLETNFSRLTPTWRVVAAGNNADPAQRGNAGVYSPDGTRYGTYSRSYTVVLFGADSNVVIDVNAYDVYGSADARAAMAQRLATIPDGMSVVVYTSDEPREHRLEDGIADAMARIGAGEKFFSNTFKGWSAYALLGRGGIGRGGGDEIYIDGGVDNSYNSWFNQSFTIINGRISALGTGGAAVAVRAAVSDEAAARSNADGALSTRATTLEAQMSGGQDSWLATRIRDEATASANRDSAIANRASTLEAQMAGNQGSWLSSRISDEATASTNRDSALANRTSALETSSRNSNNWVPNSEFVDTTGWNVTWNGLAADPLAVDVDSYWAPAGTTVLRFSRAGVPPSGSMVEVQSPRVPVVPGSFIQFYALLASHRARGWTSLFWRTATDGDAGYAGENFGNMINAAGKDLNGWEYVGKKSVQVPSNATAAIFVWRVYEYGGAENPIGWMLRPYIGEAVQNQTAWNPYSPGPSRNTQVATNSRLADEATARSTADASLASRASTLESNYSSVRTDLNNWNNDRYNQTLTVDARVSDEAATRANADGALATRSASLEATRDYVRQTLASNDLSEEGRKTYGVDAPNTEFVQWEGNHGSVGWAVHMKNPSYVYVHNGRKIIKQQGRRIRATCWYYSNASNNNFRARIYWHSFDAANGGETYRGEGEASGGDVPARQGGTGGWMRLVSEITITDDWQQNIYAVANCDPINGATRIENDFYFSGMIIEDVTQVTSANARITDLSSAMTTADSALASRTAQLEAQMRGDQGSWMASRISDEAAASANRDGALANRASALETNFSRLPAMWIVRAGGNASGRDAGVFAPDGSRYGGYSRSYTVVVFGSNGSVIAANPYDVYGNAQAREDMANFLNGIAQGQSLIIYTADEPKTGRLDNINLQNAMARVGAGEKFFGEPFRFHSAYVLLGRAGIGRGNGDEIYIDGGADTSVNSWIEQPFSLSGGQLALGGGGAATTVRAAVTDEAATRSNADGALSNRATTLEAQMSGSQDSTLAARIRDEASARATQDSALASRTSTLEARATGSGNLLQNTSWANGNLNGWELVDLSAYGVNYPGDDWHPYGENSFGWYRSSGTDGGRVGFWTGGGVRSSPVTVIGGRWYQFYVFIAAHRAAVELACSWYDRDGNGIGNDYYTGGQRPPSGGKRLADYLQLGPTSIQAPANAAFARLNICKWGTDSGESDSYCWITHPMVCEVRANTTEFVPYSPGDSRFAVEGAYAAINSEATARANADGALSSRIDSVSATANGASSTASIALTAAQDAQTRLGQARVRLLADAGNGRAQLDLWSDSYGNAGVDIVGNVRIMGNRGGNVIAFDPNRGLSIYDTNGVERVFLGIE